MTPLPLPRILTLDAATCAAMGVLLAAAAAPLAGLLALPEPLLRGAGLALFPCALFMLWASRQAMAWPAQLVVAGNLAWIAASLALFALPGIAPNALGAVFVLAQAGAVALLTLLEIRGLGISRART